MRYQITRYGTTVLIGHCKDSALKTEVQLTRTLNEVARRLTPGSFYDDGITFQTRDRIRLEPLDIVTFRTETETVTVQIGPGDTYNVIDRENIPMTLADYQMTGD